MTQYFISYIIVDLDTGRTSMDHNKYMTTGEFARRMGVTKNTLFHYDNIGLFSPEIVDTNEYRYYSIYQMEVFDTIIILKEMGMPLNEIKKFMDHRSPESLMELFEKEDKKITEQIIRLKYQQQFIRGRKEKMKGIWSIDFEHVFRKQFPNRYYIYEEIQNNTDAEIIKKTNEFITEFERRNYQMDYEIGYIQNESDISSGIYDNYTNAVILPFKKPKGMDYQVLEAGEYLTVYHKGHWNTIGAAYERLLGSARCGQLKIDDIFLETYAVNNLMAESIEDYVTEIGVRIIS